MIIIIIVGRMMQWRWVPTRVHLVKTIPAGWRLGDHHMLSWPFGAIIWHLAPFCDIWCLFWHLSDQFVTTVGIILPWLSLWLLTLFVLLVLLRYVCINIISSGTGAPVWHTSAALFVFVVRFLVILVLTHSDNYDAIMCVSTNIVVSFDEKIWIMIAKFW